MKCPKCGGELKWIDGEYDAFWSSETYVCQGCGRRFVVTTEVKGSLVTHEIWTNQRIVEVERR